MSILHKHLKEIDGFLVTVNGLWLLWTAFSHYILIQLFLYSSTLYGQCILLPQQHVHQHFSGVQRHTKLCLSLGWKQLQRYSGCAKTSCNSFFENLLCCISCDVIWSMPCLALLCHIEPPWESASIMIQDICNGTLTQPLFFFSFMWSLTLTPQNSACW